MIDIFVVALVMLIVIGIKTENPLKSFNEDYLSIESCKYYRGIFAVAVVLCHISNRTDSGVLIRVFGDVGTMAVGIFFFLSGYGLQKSYIKKGAEYQKRFLVSRLPTVLIPYIIVTFIYWLKDAVGGNVLTLKQIIIETINGRPIVNFSWYVISILMFYIAFWIFMIICRKNYSAMILCALIYDVIYVWFCCKMGYSMFWYITLQLAVFGMVWATYERILWDFMKRNYLCKLLVILLVFGVLIVFKKQIIQMSSEQIWNVAFSTIFAFSWLMIAFFAQIGNGVTAFLGEISFEIYMIHGLYVTELIKKPFFTENEFLYCLVSVTLSIVSAYILHILFSWILGKYKKLINKTTERKKVL